MNSEKYIGLDVHQATISVAVLDCTGKVVMECILETKAATILEFFAGLRGTLSVTFEEKTWATWLYDLLKPHVDQLVVCNPRKNAHWLGNQQCRSLWHWLCYCQDPGWRRDMGLLCGSSWGRPQGRFDWFARYL